MMTKKALITGLTGQDGSYLAEFLLDKGYEVHGIVRHVALEDPVHHLWRIQGLVEKIHIHSASLESYPSLFRVFQTVKPDECYHLAAQSFVGYSFDDEFSTINTNINGTHYVLSAMKEVAPDCRFYFAGSSEMFGNAQTTPQHEDTAFHPRSPYGISKVAGFYLTQNYREAYNLFACNGICFNHESERRGFEFVTRKVSSTVACIKYGMATELWMGNLDARRDWGYAPDYVRAMWMILQQATPDDFVIATGESHSVRELVDLAFKIAGLDYHEWVKEDPRLYRPAEEYALCGDASKARQVLGWQREVSFAEMVRRMVEADCRRVHQSCKG